MGIIDGKTKNQWRTSYTLLRARIWPPSLPYFRRQKNIILFSRCVYELQLNVLCFAGILGRPAPAASARRLVAFTFHPTDPFAISVQRTNSEYVVNFHLRHI